MYSPSPQEHASNVPTQIFLLAQRQAEFTKWSNQYVSRVYVFARKYTKELISPTPPDWEAVAEDIASQALLSLWKFFSGGQIVHTSMTAFLKRVVYNEALKFAEAWSNRPDRPNNQLPSVHDDEERPPDPITDYGFTDVNLSQRLDGMTLKDMSGATPATVDTETLYDYPNFQGLDDREVSVSDLLRQGFNHKEIAERLGLSSQTIGRIINSITIKLNHVG